MIHRLSRATTYITTHFVNASSGKLEARSRATGFFIRVRTAILLVTNWHVVTGINPAEPTSMRAPAPHLLKATLVGKDGMVTELSLPLYNSDLTPRWEEHPDGSGVDLAIYALPLGLEAYFDFVDIHSAEDAVDIKETVAKDVFIIGYPFSRDEMEEGFGKKSPYYLPVWKRGTIASEPAVQFEKRRLLIDSLSRPGMSGSPIVVAEDAKLLVARNAKDADVLRRIEAGDHNALFELDSALMDGETVKQFRFLGVYSGVMGTTRLSEVALGVCWHKDILRELIAKAVTGRMPFHAPLSNEFLDAFFASFPQAGTMIRKNEAGEVVGSNPIGKIGDAAFDPSK